MEMRDYYEVYRADRRDLKTPPANSALIDLLSRRTKPGDDVLDTGCGAGRSYAHWLNENARGYRGVDIAENAVLASGNAGLKAERMDNATLPLPSLR